MIGFFVALGALSRAAAYRSIAWVYNWIFRATPTLLQLYFIWYALPQLWTGFARSWFTPFMAAFIALSLNEGAYMSEIIRAGLLSVDPGQELAGRALGMSRRQILRTGRRPAGDAHRDPADRQRVHHAAKLTSLASMISLHELLTAAQELASRSSSTPSRSSPRSSTTS